MTHPPLTSALETKLSNEHDKNNNNNNNIVVNQM